MDSHKPHSTEESVIAKAVIVLPLYIIYPFVSGWAFNDFYFRHFGLDPRSLEVGLYDTLVKGFTIAPGTPWLLLTYSALLIVPLALDRLRVRFLLKMVLVLASMIAILIGVYLLSRSSGESKAQLDKGEHSTLPVIIFTMDKQDQVGKLVFMKGDVLFVHGAHVAGPDVVTNGLELSVLRLSEMKNIKIVEHQ